MYLIIEHDGTEEQTKIASFINEFAENEKGFTCDNVIGNVGEPVRVYNSNLEPVAVFDNTPVSSELDFYLNVESEDGQDD